MIPEVPEDVKVMTEGPVVPIDHRLAVGNKGSCSFYTSEHISEHQRGDRGTAGILGCYNPGLFVSITTAE